ncbi:MAG: glutaredoxin family protein [Verrucomicrobia bacterium]|nr:glutaredoxin family protein [Verrucomicrobiota bacterium]
MNPKPILYHKHGCPWCDEAMAFFAAQGVELDVRDVLADMHEMRQLVALTGQSKCPSFRYKDFIVADFSVDEFKAKAARRPDVCLELGLRLD